MNSKYEPQTTVSQVQLLSTETPVDVYTESRTGEMSHELERWVTSYSVYINKGVSTFQLN